MDRVNVICNSSLSCLVGFGQKVFDQHMHQNVLKKLKLKHNHLCFIWPKKGWFWFFQKIRSIYPSLSTSRAHFYDFYDVFPFEKKQQTYPEILYWES